MIFDHFRKLIPHLFYESIRQKNRQRRSCNIRHVVFKDTCIWWEYPRRESFPKSRENISCLIHNHTASFSGRANKTRNTNCNKWFGKGHSGNQKRFAGTWGTAIIISFVRTSKACGVSYTSFVGQRVCLKGKRRSGLTSGGRVGAVY